MLRLMPINQVILATLDTCWDFWLCKSYLPETIDRQTRRTEIDQETDRGEHVKPQGDVVSRWGFYTMEHHNTSISNIKRVSTTTLFCPLFFSFHHSFANLSAATPCLPHFVVLSHQLPFIRGGRRQMSAFLYAYSEVEVVLLCWSFTSQTKKCPQTSNCCNSFDRRWSLRQNKSIDDVKSVLFGQTFIQINVQYISTNIMQQTAGRAA